MQKDIGGASFKIAEAEKKEENFVQEILTLERHIDHITRQLEEANRNINAIATERDGIADELNNFKGIQMNQENNKTEMQRTISRYENDKHSLTA